MVAPKHTKGTGRPPLPVQSANAYLDTIGAGNPPAVKFQVITREGQDITVGRIKIHTPGNNHAFILRRFDTGALSLTTMFRAAFPGADEEHEKLEANWVKANFEAPGTNGVASGRLRLAGTWITPKAALDIAPDYHLQHIIPALISAKLEDKDGVRRSTKGGDSPLSAKTAVARQEPPASPNAPNKRARQSSPQAAPAPALAPATPATRVSTRIKSPARATPPRSTRATRATPTRATPGRTTRPSVTAFSLATAEDDAPEVPGPDPEEDIAESKALVQEIMAKHGGRTPATGNVLKRSAAEQRASELVPALMNLDGPGLQVARPIAGNRRLNIELNPEQKALAWGTLAFAFGMGVTSFILPMIS